VSEPDIVAALGPVIRALEALGVRCFVGGSIASSAHGVARASVDGDVVAELGASHVSRFAGALGNAYYLSEERIQDAVSRRSSFNLIHLETMIKVDVFVSRDRPRDRKAFSRARSTLIPGSGISMPLCSAEDVVLAKLDWYRRGGEVSERQWTDVLGVLRANPSGLDAAYLGEGAAELGVTDLLQRALGEADAKGGG
jgi:hypothetical protein